MARRPQPQCAYLCDWDPTLTPWTWVLTPSSCSDSAEVMHWWTMLAALGSLNSELLIKIGDVNFDEAAVFNEAGAFIFS